jgi:hypothetical protein
MALSLQFKIKVPDNFEAGIPFCPTSFFDTTDINLEIDWGEGGSNQTITSDTDSSVSKNGVNGSLQVTHTYSSAGRYTVKVYGGYGTSGSIDGTEKIAFAQRSNQNSVTGEVEDYSANSSYDTFGGTGSTTRKIYKIDSWAGFYVHGQGDFKGFEKLWSIPSSAPNFIYSDYPDASIQLSSSGDATILMNNTFKNCAKFDIRLDSWTTAISKCTSLQGTFEGSAFNKPMWKWRTHTSNVTNMTRMFADCPFNKSVANLDVSSITTLKEMFKDNTAYNQGMSKWFNDGGGPYNPTTTEGMFQGATSFNKYLKWDTSTITNMSSMFKDSNYSQGVQHWDTSEVTDFSSFLENTSFNKPLKNLDLGKASDVSNFLAGNTTFDKDISSLDISNALSNDNFAPNLSAAKAPTFGGNNSQTFLTEHFGSSTVNEIGIAALEDVTEVTNPDYESTDRTVEQILHDFTGGVSSGTEVDNWDDFNSNGGSTSFTGIVDERDSNGDGNLTTYLNGSVHGVQLGHKNGGQLERINVFDGGSLTNIQWRFWVETYQNGTREVELRSGGSMIGRIVSNDTTTVYTIAGVYESSNSL